MQYLILKSAVRIGEICTPEWLSGDGIAQPSPNCLSK